MNRLIMSILVAAVAACSTDQGPTGSADTPIAPLPAIKDNNVLVISFDALRHDALGVYGQTEPTSPTIDTWSRRAFVFDSAYAAAQATPASFAAAFTGQYPFRALSQWHVTTDNTLANTFRQGGYKTFGLFNNPQVTAKRGFGAGFEDYNVVSVRDQRVALRAERMLEQYKDDRFFGWIHFISPHAPYESFEFAEHLYTPNYEGNFMKVGNPGVAEPEDRDRLVELYLGEVLFVDRMMYRLLRKLRELGLDKNTVVILTSDHGEQFFEHGETDHRSPYEEVIRIPLIMRFPEQTEQVRVQAPVLTMDLLPTLASIAGFTVPEGLDGIDLSSTSQRQQPWLITAMTHMQRLGMAARKGDWKFIAHCRRGNYFEELFDLSTDPGEQNNLILDYPEIAGEIHEQVQANIGGEPCEVIHNSLQGKHFLDGFGPKNLERLRALGYIQ